MSSRTIDKRGSKVPMRNSIRSTFFTASSGIKAPGLVTRHDQNKVCRQEKEQHALKSAALMFLRPVPPAREATFLALHSRNNSFETSKRVRSVDGQMRTAVEHRANDKARTTEPEHAFSPLRES